MDDPRLIPLSALQHYAFCPRQCALIHNGQVWAENWLTAQGQLLHQRVDQGEPETRKGVRYERGVLVSALRLGLTGKLDLLEKDLVSGELLPVEYKRGKPKSHDADAIQLCAQALCLEEMTGQSIQRGALWYWQIRRRTEVALDAVLRERTHQVIAQVALLLKSGEIPHVKPGKHCQACSLREWCQPEYQARDRSVAYVADLFSMQEDDE
ncbi:CRISPR-associated protein Cas4 [Aeromonas fluvialis]|uniref:CRISPR-associated protein Cas4 n=1 Tax=Aeromonas fluvialis TaxID=591962 RepID=UPI0005A9F19B|nr:CRISPR-associated protein Cas4 [Aeromonas fluvialis]